MKRLSKNQLLKLKDLGVYYGITLFPPLNSINFLFSNLLTEEKVIKIARCYFRGNWGIIGVTNLRVIAVSSTWLSEGNNFKEIKISNVASIDTTSKGINSIEISSGNDKIEVKHIDKKALKEITQAIREPLQFQPLDIEVLLNYEISNGLNKNGIKSEPNLGYNVLKYSGIGLFTLIGLIILTSNESDFYGISAGFLLIGIALLMTPLFRTKIKKPLRVFGMVLGLVIVGWLSSLSTEKSDQLKIANNAEAELSFKKVDLFLERNDLDSAVYLVQKLSPMFADEENNPAIDFLNQYENFNDQGYLEEILISLSDKEFDEIKNGVKAGNFLNNSGLNNLFSIKVSSHNDLRTSLLNEERKKILEKEEAEKDEILKEIEEVLFSVSIEITDVDFFISVEELKTRFVYYSTWAKTVEKYSNSENEEISKLVQTLKKEATSVQTKELPLLRKTYAKIMANELWENNVYMTVEGRASKVLNITSAYFANNKNIKETQEALIGMLNSLRFDEVRYRWIKSEEEYTYYKLDSPNDSHLY